jgi:mannosyltransferase
VNQVRTDVREGATPPAPPTDPWAGRPYVLAVVGATALAAVLLLVRLGHEALWRDEIFSIHIATRSFGHAWDILLTREINMGLYYMGLWCWAQVSEGEAWIRGFSVVAATATVPLTAAVARRLLGTRVAVLAAVFLALNPFFLFYGRFARAYALTMLLVVLSTWLLLRAADRPGSVRRWVAYVVVAVLMVLATPLSLLVVGAHGLAVLGTRRSGVPFTTVLAVYGAIGLLCAPVMAWLLLQQGVMSDWIPDLTVARVLGAASDLTGSPVLVPIYGVGILWWFVSLARRRPVDAQHTLAPLLLSAWLVLPPLVIVAVSVMKPLLVGRYLAQIVPVLAILLAWAVAQVPRRALLAAAAAVVVVASAASSVQRVHFEPVPEDLRGAALDIGRRAQDGDAGVYAPAHIRLGVGWYLDHAPEVTVALDDVAVRRTTAEVGDEFPEEYDAEQIAERLQGRDRIWVVRMPGDSWHPTPEPGLEVLADAIQPDYELTYEQAYGEVLVQLYETGGRN